MAKDSRVRSTTNSEKAALGTLFKLVALGMVPQSPWQTFDIGKLRSMPILPGELYSSRTRRVVTITWETWNRSAGKAVLTFESIRYGTEKPESSDDGLWELVSLELRKPKHSGTQAEKEEGMRFKLDDRQSIEFLWSTLEKPPSFYPIW